MIGNKKRILVLGNGNSVFVQGFIREFYNKNVEVDLISIECMDSFCVPIKYKCAPLSKVRGRGKVYSYFLFLLAFSRALFGFSGKYDCVFIHSVSYLYVMPAFLLRVKARRLVSVIWGSDFYKAGFLGGWLNFIVYSLSNKITFTNPLTLADFENKFGMFSRDRLCVARFGLPVLDEIDSIKSKCFCIDLFKKYFALPLGKKIVLVGYNGSISQRHGDVIDSISRLDRDVLNKIHLVFHIGYAATGAKDRIERKLKSNKEISHSFLDVFYTANDMAKLRCISDILINVQDSDQYSGTMQETLYAGGIVIAGDWLPYEDLINNGCAIKLVSSVEEVGKAIAHVCGEYDYNKGLSKDVARKYIRKTSSWGSNIDKWLLIAFG